LTQKDASNIITRLPGKKKFKQTIKKKRDFLLDSQRNKTYICGEVWENYFLTDMKFIDIRIRL